MNDLTVREFRSRQPYLETWARMKAFIENRTATARDEIWLLEHDPVFTQGLAGKPEHVLNPHDIPIVQTDRGGQITYHGPGQLMVYLLFDLNRLALNTRTFVHQIEQTIIDYLNALHIDALAKPEAPGVYVNQRKICSIGLRVRRGLSYHGLAFNVAMDLTPFSYINPCGFKGLSMAQLRDFVPTITLDTVKRDLMPYFVKNFRYNHLDIFSDALGTLHS